jgi:hypothetical protein
VQASTEIGPVEIADISWSSAFDNKPNVDYPFCSMLKG